MVGVTSATIELEEVSKTRSMGAWESSAGTSSDESVGVRGTSYDGHPARARQTHSSAAVAKLVEEPKRTMAVCAVSPAALDRVSARTVGRIEGPGHAWQ